MISQISNILSKYNKNQINKIKDFLISEIDYDTLRETEDFVCTNTENKKEVYKDIIYAGEEYTGVYIEGNQYLISGDGKNVYIIDYIGEQFGSNINDTRVVFDLPDFLYLINNKQLVLDFN